MLPSWAACSPQSTGGTPLVTDFPRVPQLLSEELGRGMTLRWDGDPGLIPSGPGRAPRSLTLPGT